MEFGSNKTLGHQVAVGVRLKVTKNQPPSGLLWTLVPRAWGRSQGRLRLESKAQGIR